jgi:hypothetical protein
VPRFGTSLTSPTAAQVGELPACPFWNIVRFRTLRTMTSVTGASVISERFAIARRRRPFHRPGPRTRAPARSERCVSGSPRSGRI